uniref:Uncharacterized protein n=1 Tax=Salix viminalis TaxID=40686 RepID=A0A6N2MNS6_SALVM
MEKHLQELFKLRIFLYITIPKFRFAQRILNQDSEKDKIHHFKAACLRTHRRRNHLKPYLNFPLASIAKTVTGMARCLTYSKKLKTNPFTQLSGCGWSECPTSLYSRNLQIDELMISLHYCTIAGICSILFIRITSITATTNGKLEIEGFFSYLDFHFSQILLTSLTLTFKEAYGNNGYSLNIN